LVQAVYGVILILVIDVTPSGATGLMRVIVGRNARFALATYFHFGLYTGSPNEKCGKPK
jgi:hypothetical protein